MDQNKKAFFEAAGIPVFSASEFLGLTPEQEAVIETKVRLSYALRRARKAAGLTQAALAQKMNAPQQTVARLETAHKSATLDLLMRALLVAGMALEEIADEIARGAQRLRHEKAEEAGETLAEVRVIRPMQTPPPPILGLQHKGLLGKNQLRMVGKDELLTFDRLNSSRGFDDSLCRVEIGEPKDVLS